MAGLLNTLKFNFKGLTMTEYESVLCKKLSNPFYLVDKEWVNEFGWECAVLIAYIIEKSQSANENGEFELYYNQISNDLKLSKNRIAKYIKTLLDRQLIERRQTIDYTQNKAVLLYKIKG